MYQIGQLLVWFEELRDRRSDGRDGDPTGEDPSSDVATELLPDQLKCPESMDDAVGECGGHELYFVPEEEPTEEVAVEGLVEVRAKYDLIGAAALRLDRLHCALVLRALEQVRRGCASIQTALGLELLAAVHELQCLPTLDRVLPARQTSRSQL